MTNIEKLKNSFAKSLNVKPEIINDDFTYGSNGWDSIAHMVLIADIEGEFDLMIDTEDVIAMSSFKIAKDIIAKYGVDINA